MRDLFEFHRERFVQKEQSHISINGPHPLAPHVTPGRLIGPQTHHDLGGAGCLKTLWGWGEGHCHMCMTARKKAPRRI